MRSMRPARCAASRSTDMAPAATNPAVRPRQIASVFGSAVAGEAKRRSRLSAREGVMSRDVRRKGNASQMARLQWPMPAPEFVAIGHVTLDRFGDEVRLGGSALYAAITADRLGLSAGILTSHGADFPLELVPPRIEVVSVPAPSTTVFEHERLGDDRVMRVKSAAGALSEADVPDDWRAADLVLLAPVVNEVDPRIAAVFGDASVAAGAQGWLRGLGPDGTVRTVRWDDAKQTLRTLQA